MMWEWNTNCWCIKRLTIQTLLKGLLLLGFVFLFLPAFNNHKQNYQERSVSFNTNNSGETQLNSSLTQVNTSKENQTLPHQINCTCIENQLGLKTQPTHQPLAAQSVRPAWKFAFDEATHTDCFLKKYCFDYLLKPSWTYRKRKSTKLLALVMSAMSNFRKRQKIRDTWAHEGSFKDSELKTVFVLGRQKHSPSIEKRLTGEAMSYDDLLIVDFVESYDNLTLKVLAGLHWTIKFNLDVKFVLKTDDDVLINTPSLLERLSAMKTNQSSGFLAGSLLAKNPTVRRGKHRISFQQYEGKILPRYVGGSAYIMSKDVAKKLNELALLDKSTEIVRLEDLYVTGFLAKRGNIVPTQLENAKYFVEYRAPRFVEKDWKNLMVWHDIVINAKQRRSIWDSILRLSNIIKP